MKGDDLLESLSNGSNINMDTQSVCSAIDPHVLYEEVDLHQMKTFEANEFEIIKSRKNQSIPVSERRTSLLLQKKTL